MDTKTNPIPPSELIINSDGSIFHLHLRPEQLADRIVLVGDPDRVTMIGKYLSDIECDVCNREFHSITGHYAGKRLTILSHGIGGDNIDIVVNELDALANIDFNTGVTVANGTSTSGLAKGASDKLTNGGFTAVNVTPGIYEGEEPAKSTVYFSSPENRPAAEEVGKKLGISNVVESAENAQSNPIVVILRDDYKP